MKEGPEARRYLRSQRRGVLATISKKLGGYPFGSLVPFVLDHAAHPVILISRLAEHTKNIGADPRVSLLVHDLTDDSQAAARLTLVGNAARISNPGTIQTRYLNYFPDAGRLLALGDFSFYRIEPFILRFIGGFGAINWIPAASYAPFSNQLAEQESEIVAHMNTEHAHSLRDFLRHQRQAGAHEVAMAGIDCDGFDVRADGKLLRLVFDEPVANAADARRALVAMARQAHAL
jgi:putative heme iron utilization protein